MITSMYLVKRRKKIILRTMEGKKSKDETLLDWIESPKTKVQREQNKINWELAQRIRTVRFADATKKAEGLDYIDNCKAPFLPFFDIVIEDRKYDSPTYQGQAIYAKKAFEAYLKRVGRGNIICREIDKQFAKKYRTFLIHEYKTTAGKKLKDNTLHQYWKVFEKCVKEAMSERHIMYNPLHTLKGISIKDVTHKAALTIEEIRVLFNTPSDDIFKEDKKTEYIPTREFFMTCCFIGISIAEAKQLKWSHFRITNIKGKEKWEFYFKRVKTRKEHGWRPVPMQCIKRLKLLKQKFNSDYVFPNLKITSNNREYEKLKRWVARAGIEKHITPHCVRSTYISLVANAHGNADVLDMIAEIVGHSDKKITQKMYLNIGDSTMRNIVEKIPNWEDEPNLKVV